jgi:hypothetical protein
LIPRRRHSSLRTTVSSDLVPQSGRKTWRRDFASLRGLKLAYAGVCHPSSHMNQNTGLTSLVNTHHRNDPSSPWGGIKSSGVGSENGIGKRHNDLFREGADKYTQTLIMRIPRPRALSSTLLLWRKASLMTIGLGKAQGMYDMVRCRSSCLST